MQNFNRTKAAKFALQNTLNMNTEMRLKSTF